MLAIPLAGFLQEFHQGPHRDLPHLSGRVTDGSGRDRRALAQA